MLSGPGEATRHGTPASERRAALAFAAGLLVLGAPYVAAIDEVAGLYVDDAWYLVLARALATGRGFTLDNAPAAGVLPFYPPGFPALLAPLVAAAPDFPANVPLLKLASVGAVLGAACVLRAYFRRVRGSSPAVASGLALLAIAAPGLHFLVTGAVMAEGAFVLAQAAALLLVERLAAGDATPRATFARATLAGVVVAATVLVRTMGIALYPAAVAYLLLRRRAHAALGVALAGGALLGGWQAYAVLHAPTPAQQALVNDAIAWPYTEHFWARYAGHAEFGTATFRDLPARVARQASDLATRTMGALYAQPLDRLRPAGAGAWPTGVAASCALAALTLLGFALAVRRGVGVAELYVPGSLALLLVWPFPVYRHLLPLLPLLAAYAVAGAGWTAARLARSERAGARTRVACVALLVAVNAAGLVHDALSVHGLARSPRWSWRQAYRENLSVLAWVRRNVPRTVVLASHNPAMVHLFTGNPTMGAWRDETDAAHWRAAGARFWVDNTIARYRHPDFAARGATPLFRTPRRRLGVYRLPAPTGRGAGSRRAPAQAPSPSG